MPPAGARALLLARCSSLNNSLRLPRHVVTLPIHASTIHARTTRRTRAFRTSAPALARSDDPNTATEDTTDKASETTPQEEKPGTPSASTAAGEDAVADKNNAAVVPPPPPPPPPHIAPKAQEKEAPRSPAHRSTRGRAGRGGVARVESEMPQVRLPSWFVDEHVSLYESRPIGTSRTKLHQLEDNDIESVEKLLDAHIEYASLTEQRVEQTKVQLSRVLDEPLAGENTSSPERAAATADLATLIQTDLTHGFRGFHDSLYMKALAILNRQGADPAHTKRLLQHPPSLDFDILRQSWYPTTSLTPQAGRWLSNFRLDPSQHSAVADGALHGSPLASRPEPEYAVCVELLATRSVTVLSVLNHKGRSVPVSVVDDIATDLGADVVRLDAATIATLVGRYLGQNLHWSRGSVSMLGYAAAEMNGRAVSRSSLEDAEAADEGMGSFTIALPPVSSKLRSLFRKQMSMESSIDGRWEELKVIHALESLIGAVDVKRRQQQGVSNGAGASQRPLIVHVHDYIELGALSDSVITTLRGVVDGMWQKGRKVVLVGTSASEMQKSPQWRNQLVDMSQNGHHVIPFHAAKTGEAAVVLNDTADAEYFVENLSNIKNMLTAILGRSAKTDFDSSIQVTGNEIHAPMEYLDVVKLLARHVYDVQWVYRVASLMVGSRTPRYDVFGLPTLRQALVFMTDRNKQWKDMTPGVGPPYYSPLFTPDSSSAAPGSEGGWPTNLTSVLSALRGNSANAEGGASGEGAAGAAGKNIEFDKYEKKLLSGLINAKDLHTTFNDIIVPQETKDSLIGLTSLSLQRPDAFSYGVLKTERIPGCLLYGPPGTGKTLLAKAVAKESGAHMLEVSAASINDMWLGQSEKNVRALFSLARKMAPMVIFLDEADALLSQRNSSGGPGGGGGGRSGHREVITQFLREWDGLSDMRSFIMVATNRPFDLDEAVLRRLPRKILVDLPLGTEREGILGVMLREEVLGPDVDLKVLAGETELFSGSDLKNLCVSAAMAAVREENEARDGGEEKEDAAAAAEFVFPEKRVLTRAHFEKGMREISASISEDMESLKAIRKFDSQYGDAGRKKRTKRWIILLV
ncbi:hypothetical protein B0T17DRAFT_586494 [Bombardia bombarda]|uniref:AAA+ ATPase domain-containing protein n=1 Tax=Bombardia bombarda TaxID=252184 RepID=A0AA39XKK2_9PEZI|nr:hypothetical protein B0T17DRAFT_586494 [Bombardia bombarda]